ncbi:MAG: hypothetical protein ABI416_15185 [Ginsengibacter sp.]
MIKKLLPFCLIILIFLTSCNSKPSNADIEKKILLEYTCAETAKVNSLQIVKSSPTTSILGFKGFEYLVSGVVEWPSGCTEFGTALPSGFKEKFENKTVTLIKSNEGWQ